MRIKPSSDYPINFQLNSLRSIKGASTKLHNNQFGDRESKEANNHFIKEMSMFSLGNYFSEIMRRPTSDPNLRQGKFIDLINQRSFPNLLKQENISLSKDMEEEIFYSLLNYNDDFDNNIFFENLDMDDPENKLVKEIFDKNSSIPVFFDRGFILDARRNASFNSSMFEVENLELFMIYKAISEFANADKLQEIDLAKILDRNIMDDQFKSNAGKFSLNIDRNKLMYIGYNPEDKFIPGFSSKLYKQAYNEKFYQVRSDAPLSIILEYKKEPIAQLGFSFFPKENAISINQLQLIKHFKEDEEFSRVHGVTGNINAQKVLVESLIELAVKNGFSKVYMQSAENNLWTKYKEAGDENPHLDLELARKIYNQTAEDLYFTPTDEYSPKVFQAMGSHPNYVKNLNFNIPTSNHITTSRTYSNASK